MSNRPQLYCPCLRLGKDGTLCHDNLVAEVTSIRHEAEVTSMEHSNRFYVCRNHLHLYAQIKSDYSIRAIAGGELSPRQSTFSLGGN